MLDQLFSLVKEMGAAPVIENPVVPNEQNEAVLVSATQSVTEEMQTTLAGGGLQQVLSLFGGQNTGSEAGSHPLVQSILANFSGKLTGQHGLSTDQAGQVAGDLIPSVLSQLVNRTNDPGDSRFDLNGLIGSLTGGGGQLPDMNGILSRFSKGGLDADGDGKVELEDIISKVSGAASQARGGSGGGMMDMIQGFLK